MNRKGKLFLRFAILILSMDLQTADASSDLFFPFGLSEGDDFLPANDDGSTAELPITVVFPFFDHDYTSLFVNNNGAISFLGSVSQFTSNAFPVADGRPLLTPFWADVDTRLGGNLTFREVLRFSQSDGIFIEADDIIRANFIEMRGFRSSWLYTATWDKVPFFGAFNNSITNSFQAVLVTDGRYSFVIFNYGDINWTTGTASDGNIFSGLGGTPAQVGFNAGDGVNYYSVSGSRTDSIVDIETTSNIGVPGRWVFRVDNSNIGGLTCTTSGDISLFPLVGSMLGGTQVFVSGPCFNSTSLIACDFDGTVTNGKLLSNEIGICISPPFYKVGRVPLRVSLDDGATFDFSGTFTIISIEAVPGNVFSSVMESSVRESDLEITWDTYALENVTDVDIVVYGYREKDEIELRGPLFSLAQGVDYSIGHHSVSGIVGTETNFDIGVIGIMESEEQGGNLTRSVLWSKVHVLQWYNGHNVSTWCPGWIAEEALSDRSFLSNTPECPCTLAQAEIDIGRFSPHPECDIDISSPSNCIHKHGAFHCVRADTPSISGGGQECCYDINGEIIDVANNQGGGYSHRYHHGGVLPYGQPQKVPYLSHYVADILPWTYCCRFDQSLCTSYGSYRPSQTCTNYVPPSPALGNGDPHISTLDSTTYTFNGYGEFTLLTALDGAFVLQSRAAPLDGISGATVFVAIAARFDDSDVIHVQTNERRVLDAYVRESDGESFTRIDFDQAPRWSFTGVSVTGRNITEDGVILAFDRGVGLTVKASEGAMSIFLVAPESFQGQTHGLMGTWNRMSGDDFETPQGNVLSPDLTTEELHYQFGLLWEIDVAQSLFYYEPGANHESHTDRSYIPVFEPPINMLVDQSLVIEVCGTNQFCIFDFQTTGSQSFAQNSVNSFSTYQQAVESRAAVLGCPPAPIPNNGSVNVTSSMPGGVATFGCDAGFELNHVVTLTCQSNGVWSDGSIPTCETANKEPTDLSVPIIIGISVGVALLVVAIIIIIVVTYKWMKLKPAARIGPDSNHGGTHANPTYVTNT
ncbi:LOW QUALITY PROTEIN: sushi domain-containing protein 2-like [Lytechinus variegatus]|uniref:LOW QUALITY PROTEIN: sushi domain-containing protein 2-like n=1 Tax=Lytechinus variegatus TaxID=7654 RepID=UPI001BB2085D|nr:LOW QUALITY PROTEIN: sushi domain-containing protein 2-like [Lytechinus variegatus]